MGLTSGAQPIESADGSACLSVNGEVYNYQELQDKLQTEQPVEFATDSDCEVKSKLTL